MAEVQTADHSGEMAQRFIELVMMQAQNAAFALGQIPHPETGEAPVNLDLARLFIDQLHVLRAKTRGNLSDEETSALNSAISNLQMAYVEVARQAGEPSPEPAPAEAPAVEAPAAADAEPAASAPSPEAASAPEEESKKKFTKSYGA